MAVATDRSQQAQVRALWAAYSRGGIDAVAAQVGREVELRPLGMSEGEDVWGERGRRHADRVAPVLHALETHGSCVLARGSLRTFREGGFVDVQPSWAYFFRGQLLVRAVGYTSRAEALRAIAEFNAEA